MGKVNMNEWCARFLDWLAARVRSWSVSEPEVAADEPIIEEGEEGHGD